MAKRYSGDIELRISCKLYKGWSGKKELFYFASVAAPGHRGKGILSPSECDVDGDPRTPEAYDKAALAFLNLAHKETGVGKYAAIEDGEFEIIRVQQAPCPSGMAGSPNPRKRKRNNKFCCSACAAGKRCASRRRR